MKFNAVQVKEVMQKTGCGEWDCQRALSEHDGNVDAAVRFLFESSKVILEGVEVYDWWRVAKVPLFTHAQYEHVLKATGGDKFTCERALAETSGDLNKAVILARKYMREKTP
ncbi:MAG: hypothetical protein WC975_10780 [Phycisphaerae bacterium]